MCQAGWGVKNSYTCVKCVNKSVAVALFAIATLVLLFGIRLWAYLAGGQLPRVCFKHSNGYHYVHTLAVGLADVFQQAAMLHRCDSHTIPLH